MSEKQKELRAACEALRHAMAESRIDRYATERAAVYRKSATRAMIRSAK